MASFSWAYVNCNDTVGDGGSGSTGPAYSLQFLTASGGGHTTGSAYLTYYTGSVGAPEGAGHTLHLTGTFIVNGAISASSFHVEDIEIIGATGSTYFGNSDDDVHIRTGSLLVGKSGYTGADYILSASAADESVHVRGFAGNYTSVTTATYVVQSADYVIGVVQANNVTVTLPGPSGSNRGRIVVVKDEMPNRGTGSITVTGSLDSSYIDNEVSYTMTGSFPAINLYSNGTNWFVF